MKDTLILHIKNAIQELTLFTGEELDTLSSKIALERPGDMSHGDYATNIALICAPKAKKSPLSLAVDIVEKLKLGSIEDIEKIEVAGPGFINFYIKKEAFRKNISDILSQGDTYGSNITEKGKKIAFEYTDPNPFKVFHIGHLMQNTIGETLTRIAEAQGAEVRRFCYQGDVGRHVALTMWGLRLIDQGLPNESATISEKVAYFGKAYALGATRFKKLEDEGKNNGYVDEQGRVNSAEFLEMEKEIREINKKIYDRSDEELNQIYDIGKEWSLEHFEELYEILGTKFDRYFFESQATPKGIEIVKAHTYPKGKGVFKESNGAVIFEGEAYGLHTRVFINRDGIPTYDGKEIGLVPLKYEAYPYDIGITVTANEQDEYFKVVYKAASFIFEDIAPKLKHVSHGMLKLTTGKMSSRTGDVITGESLLKDMIEQSLTKMKEREMTSEEKEKVAKDVAVSAIKYTVLRQSLGKDIVFDPEKSLSFEGDSGPYLQYSYVRAKSLLAKAKDAEIVQYVDLGQSSEEDSATLKLEKTLERFPETVLRAWRDMGPHHISNYLTELAGTFNSYYANTHIVKADDPASAYRVALVQAFSIVMKNGLFLLGIRVPEKM